MDHRRKEKLQSAVDTLLLGVALVEGYVVEGLLEESKKEQAPAKEERMEEEVAKLSARLLEFEEEIARELQLNPRYRVVWEAHWKVASMDQRLAMLSGQVARMRGMFQTWVMGRT